MAVEVFLWWTKGQVLSLSRKCHRGFIKQIQHLSAFPTAVSVPLSIPWDTSLQPSVTHFSLVRSARSELRNELWVEELWDGLGWSSPGSALKSLNVFLPPQKYTRLGISFCLLNNQILWLHFIQVAVIDIKMSLHYRSRLQTNLSSAVPGSSNGLTASGSNSDSRGAPQTAGRTEGDFKNRLNELVVKQCCAENPENGFLLYVTAVFREVGLCVYSSRENWNSCLHFQSQLPTELEQFFQEHQSELWPVVTVTA